MDSQNDKEENLNAAGEMIEEACRQGASIVVLPENMNFTGRGLRHQAEPVPGHTTDFLAALAKQHGIWIVSGSFPEICTEENPRNTLVVIDPNGEICCKYSKLHMFDIDLSDGTSFHESHYTSSGEDIVLCETPLGTLGLTICYDLRFGELYRLLALRGAEVVFVPACFSIKTGPAHWEVLLRARAIENGVYIVACDQTGEKSNITAYGHSMVIDPWGKVIAKTDETPGVLMAEIDLSYIDEVRAQIPVLKNRREDIYELSGKKG